MPTKRRRCCGGKWSSWSCWQFGRTNCKDQRYFKILIKITGKILTLSVIKTGCHVIGFAGSDDKVKWLVDELGFDRAFNYKSTDCNTSLKEAAPNGVDCYFDNVWKNFI